MQKGKSSSHVPGNEIIREFEPSDDGDTKKSPDLSVHQYYSSSKFNLNSKIKRDANYKSFGGRSYEYQDDEELDQPIDDMFPRALDQHSDRIDSWRSFNSDLDGDTQPSGMCVGRCKCNQARLTYLSWPIWWLLYHVSCCCLCSKSTGPEHPTVLNKMSVFKSRLKHLKRRQVNRELKAIYALIQLLKKSPDAVSQLEQVRINPKIYTTSVK